MANGKTTVPQVAVAIVLSAVVAIQAWSLSQIFNHGKAIAAMQVEQRYSDREREETRLFRIRIEEKIDANAAALAALRGGD